MLIISRLRLRDGWGQKRRQWSPEGATITESDRVAVFSEIYYPDGWHATVDGQPLDLFRADWTLRAALLPAGEHNIEMYFMPESYRIGAGISRATSILLILLLLGSLVAGLKNSRVK